ncbi:MAG: transcription-repair coupling factor [Candidatus Omnitrophota bacterium]
MFKALKLFVAQTVDIDHIAAQLVTFGYRWASAVSNEGDFSRRGGIIDIFPSNFDSPVRLDFDGDIIRSIQSIDLLTGRSTWQHNIVFILPKKIPKENLFTADTPLNHFVDIKEGDYVVHNTHGVGKFLGATEISKDKKLSEHLIIEYEGGDRLFVPKHDIHLIQKYLGFTKKPPRLFKLGSKEWDAVKGRIQKRIQQFAVELLHLQALRASLGGYAFSKDAPWQKQFENTFPFEETPDQIRAAEDVKSDMESSFPMDRLLCGDVGYGKTEVALRAAFKAVMDNKQAAILVPTTILAEQHYFNFSQRLKEFPVRVDMLSRFKTRRQQSEIVKELKLGKIDIIIGTHRLLSKDIQFKELGLIVIDEEQRFGVRSKEKLKHVRLLADVLTLTATPIPRTLYMALAGARDMSVINTPPKNRIPVSTHLIELDEDLIRDAIDKELRRKGQVFFLHNRVENIEKIASLVKRLAPHARIAIAHGQMPPKTLEKIMLDFLGNNIDVLVCTTIIESGIDVPNANTLIVNNAHHFGLADLHQLRGRVGRFTQKAYAYFIIPPQERLSSLAKSRLKALEQFSDLGSGFNIAFEDLQIRGAGNLLGAQQHGYISSIGFDLYCRLLKESIENIKKHAKIGTYEKTS